MSTKYGGYMGKVVWLDLSTGEHREYPWTDRERELYTGGKTMAAKILGDNFTGSEEPFSEENMLVITTGPLTGSGAPSSSRFNISTLSPQTGIISSSNSGGTFGYYLKKAGLDALIISGKCPERSWVEIDGDDLTIHSAEGLWGLRSAPAHEFLDEKLREKHGKDVKHGVITIGPAGENLVKYSAVLSGERVSGRTGIGAVMGWKNLKAVTVTGERKIELSSKELMQEWNKKWTKYIREHPLTGKQLPEMGTAGLTSMMQMRGIMPTKNFTHGRYEEFDKVSGETLAEEHNIKNKGCLTCPIRCARTVSIDGREVKGPELETLGLMGGGILNNDLELILKWNAELEELGMDTISAAGTLAWAMEANEKGLWDNGLSFGDVAELSGILEDIAYRRGIGDELAEGTRRLSEKYGGREFAMHSKGLELASYEPRRAVGQGLGYAVSNRGGCHLNGGYLVILEGLGLNIDGQTHKAKADFTMMFQNLMEMVSASGQCLFTTFAFFPASIIAKPNSGLTRFINWIAAHIGWGVRLINKFPGIASFHLPVFHHTRGFEYATGMKMNFGRYIRCGERGYNLERSVSAKFGVSAKDDTLPRRLTHEQRDSDDPKSIVPLDKMKKKYYAARGWGQDGLPTEKTLRKLELS